MKFFKKLKSSNFWVSMISAVVLILQAVFNVDIKTEYLNQIILGILGILVMTGIVTDTPNNEVTVKQEIDLEKVKETITLMFTQVSNTLLSDVTKIMSQFETVNNIVQTKEINQDNNEETSVEEVVKNEEIVEEKEEQISLPKTILQEIDIPKNEL